eukprot:1190792-Prorocentrum_minimum.AAC.1
MHGPTLPAFNWSVMRICPCFLRLIGTPPHPRAGGGGGWYYAGGGAGAADGGGAVEPKGEGDRGDDVGPAGETHAGGDARGRAPSQEGRQKQSGELRGQPPGANTK